MAFCRNCGREVQDGIKYCTSCGAAANDGINMNGNYEYDRQKQSMEMERNRTKKKRNVRKEKTVFDIISMFFGVILFVIAMIDFISDPPILTVILSIVIIVGAIFCLSQRYRLKGFTIIALIIAVISLIYSINQGSKIGFLTVPDDEEYAEAYGSNTAENGTPSIQIELDDKSVAADANPTEEEMPDTVEEPETGVNDEPESIDGVDPDLRAFLDSYEEFMDEYIVFMKKYMADPGNAVSMITEYASIMEKYGEFADAIDKYDEEEMSTEDAKYYLEVTTRVTQKMMEIYN